MGGLERLFMRITPIIMLICFICIGITYTFGSANEQEPLTYLTNEVVTVDDRGTPETTDDVTIDNYTFDFTAYRNNINADYLKSATQNIIDIEAYETTLATFKLLWDDGYQIGDVIKTIGNAVILVINTLFVGLNIFLMPIRIITALILTSLSIFGINITRQEGIIIPFLRLVVNKLAVPLINQTDENTSNTYETLTNTTWLFNNQLDIPQGTYVEISTNLNFQSNNHYYTVFIIDNTPKGVVNNPLYKEYNPTIYYGNGTHTDNLTEVYKNGNWINNNYKTIYIESLTNQNQNTTLSIWLNKYATKQTTTPIDNNIYQWYETPIMNYTPTGVEGWFVQANIESNNETFVGFALAIDDTSVLIAYYTNNNSYIIVFNNGNWTDIYYRQFKIINTQALDNTSQTKFNQLLTNNFITIYE